MSGLFASLYTTSNALQAQTASLDIIGRNMANVNNPAYARQRVVLGDKGSVSTPLGAQSLGTEAVGIRQMRDASLDRQIREQNSFTATYDSQTKYFQQAQTAFSQGLFNSSGSLDSIGSTTDVATGLASSLDAFFNSWQSFATDPTNIVSKQQLVAATDNLVNGIRTADRRLGDIALPSTGNTLTAEIDAQVTIVNGLLKDIANLNRQIGSVEIVNAGAAVDLRDQRGAKLEELAKYLDFAAVQQPSGQIAVQVRDSTNNPVNLVDLSVVPGSLARNGTGYDWTPTSGPAVTLDVSAGSLNGLMQVGASVQGYRTQFDTFVQNLVTQVNTAYNSTVNGAFFDAAGLTAATISRTATVATVRAADVGGAAGGNDRALAVASLAGNGSFLSGTPAQAFARIVTAVAQDVASNTSRYEDQQSLGDFLAAQRNSYGGVSLDEETANMLQIQRSYQASAKIMSVINDMLAEVMNTLAR